MYQQIKEKMENKTIAQFLGIKDFPYEIKDNNGNTIYIEYSDGFWYKLEYDLNNNLSYYEQSNGYWVKYEFNSSGNLIYYKDSRKYWVKYDYNHYTIICFNL